MRAPRLRCRRRRECPCTRATFSSRITTFIARPTSWAQSVGSKSRDARHRVETAHRDACRRSVVPRDTGAPRPAVTNGSTNARTGPSPLSSASRGALDACAISRARVSVCSTSCTQRWLGILVRHARGERHPVRASNCDSVRRVELETPREECPAGRTDACARHRSQATRRRGRVLVRREDTCDVSPGVAARSTRVSAGAHQRRARVSVIVSEVEGRGTRLTARPQSGCREVSVSRRWTWRS